MMQAREGPWKDTVSAVTFTPQRPAPNSHSLQNATEDAVETVWTDGVEAYRSPYIHHQLKTCSVLKKTRESRPLIGSLELDPDAFASFIGTEGTQIDLPQDGPPLPENLVASIKADSTHAYKAAYFHVDTGATCLVTDHACELHCPVPTHATCGTAAKGPRTTINVMGCLVLDFISDKGHHIPLEFPQATEIQQFQRRSLSCHALKDLGYEVQHAFLLTGNLLRLRKIGTKEWHAIPLVTYGRSDYVKVKLHLPSVEGLTTFTPTSASSTNSSTP
jgi:hypothetical protein